MTSWKHSLCDTCSLITLDKILLVRASLGRHFPKSLLALRRSLLSDQMQSSTAKRIEKLVAIQPLPSTHEIAGVISSEELPFLVTCAESYVLATAIHFRLPVLTNSRQLGKCVQRSGLEVTDMALVLRDLVRARRLAKAACEDLMQGLAERNELILRTPSPTWEDLEAHNFP